MYLQGHIVVYENNEYIILNVDYSTRILTIGIPDADNVTRNRLTVNWRKVKHQ